jgi:hypothetical protein
MADEEEVADFIRSTFRSVWTLELWLLLKRDRRGWSAREIVAALRASDLIVSRGLGALAAAGLIVIEDGGAASFRAGAAADARLADRVEALYAQSPDAVRRLIAGPGSGLAAFAESFRLRRD